MGYLAYKISACNPNLLRRHCIISNSHAPNQRTIRIYLWMDAGNCRKLKTDRRGVERKAPSWYLIHLAGFGRRFDSLQSSPIRYRGSRVYFGPRYYRGVDFIVNIYEGGSLGSSHPRLPFHRRPHHYHRCRYQRSYYRLPPSPPLPIYSTLYALFSRLLRRFVRVFSKKSKYEKELIRNWNIRRTKGALLAWSKSAGSWISKGRK